MIRITTFAVRGLAGIGSLILGIGILGIGILGIGILGIGILGCSPNTIASLSQRKLAIASLETELGEQNVKTLGNRVERVLLSGLENRKLSTELNAAWQIMHGVVCYGEDLQVETPDRGVTGALDYAFSGGQIHGFQLMLGSDVLPATGRRGLMARIEPGSYEGQGHVDQWLAILAMADLPIDTPIHVGDQIVTIEDWVRQAQYDVSNNLLDEYSWTLIALTHYLPDEPTWQAKNGSTVSWELLVEAELTYDIDLSPCGGTHRLAGIVRAIHAKNRLNLPDSEVWSRAENQVQQLLESVKEHRGADGKLSSFYFTKPGRTADLTAELSSAGHLFEFIALACSEQEIKERWVELSANRLCGLLEATEPYDLDCGSLYHALAGLKIYHRRRF